MALTQVPIELSSTPGIVDNSNATAITIDSSENVGIGTSSPNASADLHVADTSDARIWLEATSGDTMELYAGTNVSLFNRSNNALTFGTNNTERMRIDSSGNVGIGVTPESWNTYKTLQIGNGAIANYTPTHDMRMVSNAYYNSGWKYAESDGACLYLQDGNNSQHIWSVAASGTADAALTWSEAMRIDSSRNLLVGKTSSSVSGSGLTVIANDFMSYTNTSTDSGDRCLILNRQNGSGNILDFQQANGLVGSIGTANSGDLYIGNDDTSLLFAGGSDAILPRGTAGATRDAAIDLGLSAHRFKDLYLSGGAYLGGTGSANKLEDYEEGAWVPILRGDGATVSGQSYGAVTGHYVKVGQLVYLGFDFALTAAGSTSGSYAVIGSLPFPALSSNLGGGSLGYYVNLSGITGPVVFYVAGSQAYLMTGGSTYVARTAIANDTRLIGFLSYRTSA
jgi:hypothetical protein